MKITSIKQQVKRQDRFSIYVDEKYSFSLHQNQVLDLGIKIGLELTESDIVSFKKQSDFGKLFDKTLRYLSMRLRSERELSDYLKRKEATPEEAQQIIDKVKKYGYVNDRKFAEMWISDRRDIKKRSTRRLQMELNQKGVSKDIIKELLEDTQADEEKALQSLVEKKLRIARYQDKTKLTRYLLQQGFSYDLVKKSLDSQGSEQEE